MAGRTSTGRSGAGGGGTGGGVTACGGVLSTAGVDRSGAAAGILEPESAAGTAGAATPRVSTGAGIPTVVGFRSTGCGSRVCLCFAGGRSSGVGAGVGAGGRAVVSGSESAVGRGRTATGDAELVDSPGEFRPSEITNPTRIKAIAATVHATSP